MYGGPEVQFAETADRANIAFQVFGDGPVDLVLVPGIPSHLDLQWEHPVIAEFLERLGEFARVVTFDLRGCGLSDPFVPGQPPTLEQRADDIMSVLDAAGSDIAVLFASLISGPPAVLCAATHPGRFSGLVLYDTYAATVDDPEIGIRVTPEQVEDFGEAFMDSWRDDGGLTFLAPELAADRSFRDWWIRYARASMSYGLQRTAVTMALQTTTRALLPGVRTPTLVVRRAQNSFIPPVHASYLATAISGARLVELPGTDHLPFANDIDDLLGEIEEFVTGARHAPEANRVLATVLFTDIVGSTEHGASVGDRQWRSLLDRHDDTVRRQLRRFRGTEVKTVGDGVFALFDGPARAVRCACAIRDTVKALGLSIRAGVHTGEIERRGDDATGIAVNIGARITSLAEPDQVLVSSTVKDLVAGAGLSFDDMGMHSLKGVPDAWRLFAVTDASP